jgi:flavin reductase (DIM6/NTAB) family NADH-FMN oxidoreductase RutF/rubredoxin
MWGKLRNMDIRSRKFMATSKAYAKHVSEKKESIPMDPRALHKISYGLYVVCSKKDERINGQIANALFQVSAEPQTIAVSINKQNLTHEYIKNSGLFTVSVLNKETPMKFIGIFGFQSGRNLNKFNNVRHTFGVSKCPYILDFTIAYFEAQVIDSIDVITHTVFIGKVLDSQILTEEEPMTYDYYHKVKGGYSPKTAPTYSAVVDKQQAKEEKKMDKYVCSVCGYVYDPEKGDPDSNIEPGTAFEDLPADWVCPVCGAPKDAFEKE